MRFAKPLFALALGSIVATPASADLDIVALKQSIELSFEAGYPGLDALYKDIHAHPELAFQEVKTAAKLAAEMRAIGFEVTERVGRTGLVALYRNGDGPTIMVRTELDALPMEEKTGLPYASRDKATWQGSETFVSHSCGHDIHMASWVGAAKALVELKDRWKGTLMFIAQPGEEVGAGAMAMLADGLFTRFPKPDVGFALHSGGGASPYGSVSYTVGVRSSAADALYVRFAGRGGHGAMPQATIDPVMMASRFVVDVQSVVSREKDPTKFAVVSIGSLHAGTSGNIIPDEAVLQGTIRTFDAEVRARIHDGIKRTARAVAEMAGAPAPLVVITDGVKALVNDDAVVATAEKVLRTAFGDKLRLVPPVTASEDYSEYISSGVPSMFFNIGVYAPEAVAASLNGGSPLPGNHSPLFAPVPKPTIQTGVIAMTLAVLSAFDRGMGH
ncbi:amidohydrolase [Bradyrhizobium diazoefficiens]|nr:amidohydrolase [Bradyrhizobium diazoefficiens]MBR0849186.1 amidohydrolase [Bradyrhizobium diazoefficiens]